MNSIEGRLSVEVFLLRSRQAIMLPRFAGCFCLRSYSSPLKDIDEHHDDGQHQKDVNEPSHGVTTHHPEEPEKSQNHGNCVQHTEPLSVMRLICAALVPLFRRPAAAAGNLQRPQLPIDQLAKDV
jgi:hypothetical protein